MTSLFFRIILLSALAFSATWAAKRPSDYFRTVPQGETVFLIASEPTLPNSPQSIFAIALQSTLIETQDLKVAVRPSNQASTLERWQVYYSASATDSGIIFRLQLQDAFQQGRIISSQTQFQPNSNQSINVTVYMAAKSMCEALLEKHASNSQASSNEEPQTQTSSFGNLTMDPFQKKNAAYSSHWSFLVTGYSSEVGHSVPYGAIGVRTPMLLGSRIGLLVETQASALDWFMDDKRFSSYQALSIAGRTSNGALTGYIGASSILTGVYTKSVKFYPELLTTSKPEDVVLMQVDFAPLIGVLFQFHRHASLAAEFSMSMTTLLEPDYSENVIYEFAPEEPGTGFRIILGVNL